MIASEAEVELSWERLRGRLRTALLCGDVVFKDGSFDVPHERQRKGVDTLARAGLWDVLKAMFQVRSNDPFGHRLLVMNVGHMCGDEECIGSGPVEGGRAAKKWDMQPAIHWHKESWTPFYEYHKKPYLQARLDQAMAAVVEKCE